MTIATDEVEDMSGSTIPMALKLTKKAGDTGPTVPGNVDYDEILIVGVERLWNPSIHEPDTVVLEMFCVCDGTLMYVSRAIFEPEWGRYFAQPWAPGGGSPG